VIDGNIASFHVLEGGTKKSLFKYDKVELPKKHGRGGQSKNRFARIREEKRDWYTTKIGEFAIMHFIDGRTCRPNIDGLILAGCADLKFELGEKLDGRLKEVFINYVDVQYGGESGFNEAIVKSQELLANVEFMKERKVLVNFFEHISKSTELFIYGLKETMYVLTAGCAETLIIWDQLPYKRVEVVSKRDSERKDVFYLKSEDEMIDEGDEENDWEIVEEMPLLDWILEHYKDFGSNIELVSDQSSEGSQFAIGFGGFGAILRYPFQIPQEVAIDYESDEEDSFEWEW